ncbi:PaREP1 family protein [Acidianus hospitalis W1]|uniref:PaREP1 family protein n=1 Tax=Acidianus hospitalis (strain W1) TaxID=933801 RepID=F4B577_ACIHW|nr:PaREP1 family protein [Acidianus hospitalis]AEE93171.1 PaREP1 family protein [Acidianus hospitalis W1]
MLTKDSIEKLLKEADELLDRGDTLQASEKLYKAAEEAIKVISFKNSIRTILKVKSLGHWSSKMYFEAVDELESIYPGIKSLWISAWILRVEGFHEISLDQKSIKLLKIDVEKIVKLL